ncbi:MAG TPA: hydroxymethylbilane synthase [Abditibacteriaceae bacterium]|jgi:hydroxymethylbilane synthase
MQTLVMGTRGSPLALAQSRQVAAALMRAHENLTVEERIISTTGDRQQTAPLPAIGGKGVFTLEIERALLEGSIDFAVHSLKDLPPDLPAGLHLGSIPARAPVADVCILNPDTVALFGDNDRALPFLPEGARVGTSSLRRRAQLLNLRRDLVIQDVRGNIDTRLKKLRAQPFDAIVLAAAGIERLGVVLDKATTHTLDETLCVPAPGQGALALECRIDDERTNTLLKALNCDCTRAEIAAERAAMRALNAGCSTPLGARALCDGTTVSLHACVLATDGARRLEARASAAKEDAHELGFAVAQDLLRQGARELMQ